MKSIIALCLIALLAAPAFASEEETGRKLLGKPPTKPCTFTTTCPTGTGKYKCKIVASTSTEFANCYLSGASYAQTSCDNANKLAVYDVTITCTFTDTTYSVFKSGANYQLCTQQCQYLL